MGSRHEVRHSFGGRVLLEKELKYELCKADYSKLLRAVRSHRPNAHKLQNFYFDDRQLRLRKKRYALRIRIIDGKKYFFTLKYPAKQPKNSPRSFKVRVEHEFPISKTLALKVLRQDQNIMELDLPAIRILKRQFSKNILSKIAPLGMVECTRTVVPLEKWLELEIDRCKIYNKKFYELEVETSQPVKVDKAVRIFLKANGIPYHPIARSKFARFVQEWKKRHR